MKNRSDLLIGIVGVCAAGKTTLIKHLKERGYQTRHIAQEHSYVQDMWKKITNPDLLICLEVSYQNSMKRKKLNWYEKDFQVEFERLAHAREHADLVVQTDSLNADEVLVKVINFVENYFLTD